MPRSTNLPSQGTKLNGQKTAMSPKMLRLKESCAAHMAPGSIIPLRSKSRRRLYEPIVLLVALNQACSHNEVPQVSEAILDVEKSPENAFKCFMNKLGHICDSERGGATVTAFVLLQLEGKVQYRFAANQLLDEFLEKTRLYVVDILSLLGTTKDSDLREIDSRILQLTLDFCKPRVSIYLRTLWLSLTTILESWEQSDHQELNDLLKKLIEIQELSQDINDNALDDSYSKFAQDCELLIHALESLYRSNLGPIVEGKSREALNSNDEDSCWCKLHHSAGRLRAYLHAPSILISIRKRWPQIFQAFEVTYVSSSEPQFNPLQTGSRRGGMFADEIIDRMSSDKTRIATYKAQAESLQQYNLDARIQEQATNRRFKPIVHAEVLLLDSLEKDGGTDGSRFFKGWQYIGASKPTCRLCHYYFSVHPSGVQVRPTHRNVYPNWAVPTVSSEQGFQGAQRREELIDNIIEPIREDAFKLLDNKQPERKKNDSNDNPTVPIFSVSSVAEAAVGQLTGSIKRLELSS